MAQARKKKVDVVALDLGREEATVATLIRVLPGELGTTKSIFVNGSERVYPCGVPLKLSEPEYHTLVHCGIF